MDALAGVPLDLGHVGGHLGIEVDVNVVHMALWDHAPGDSEVPLDLLRRGRGEGAVQNGELTNADDLEDPQFVALLGMGQEEPRALQEHQAQRTDVEDDLSPLLDADVDQAANPLLDDGGGDLLEHRLRSLVPCQGAKRDPEVADHAVHVLTS